MLGAGLDDDPPVRGLENARRQERGVVVPLLGGHVLEKQVSRSLKIHHLNLGFEKRGVHPLSFARDFALEQGDHNPLREHEARR